MANDITGRFEQLASIKPGWSFQTAAGSTAAFRLFLEGAEAFYWTETKREWNTVFIHGASAKLAKEIAGILTDSWTGHRKGKPGVPVRIRAGEEQILMDWYAARVARRA